MSVSDHDQDRQTVLDAFDKQIGWCEKLASPFTARLLTILRDDIAAGGASAELALGWPGEPVADALALRMAGALHALALTGSAPALVPCYPPSAAPVEPLRPVVLDVVREHQSAVRAFRGQLRSGVFTHRRTRRQRFPASVKAARTLGTRGIDDVVPNFRMSSVNATVELSVEHDPAADPGAHGHINQSRAIPSRAPPGFSQGGSVAVILQRDPQVKYLSEIFDWTSSTPAGKKI